MIIFPVVKRDSALRIKASTFDPSYCIKVLDNKNPQVSIDIMYTMDNSSQMKETHCNSSCYPVCNLFNNSIYEYKFCGFWMTAQPSETFKDLRPKVIHQKLCWDYCIDN